MPDTYASGAGVGLVSDKVAIKLVIGIAGPCDLDDEPVDTRVGWEVCKLLQATLDGNHAAIVETISSPNGEIATKAYEVDCRTCL